MKLHSSSQHAPKIGEWYRLQEYPLSIVEIISIDQKGTITAQCIDGELDEIDAEQWPELSPHITEDNHWARVVHFEEEIDLNELNETDLHDLPEDSKTSSHFVIPREVDDYRSLH